MTVSPLAMSAMTGAIESSSLSELPMRNAELRMMGRQERLSQYTLPIMHHTSRIPRGCRRPRSEAASRNARPEGRYP